LSAALDTIYVSASYTVLNLTCTTLIVCDCYTIAASNAVHNFIGVVASTTVSYYAVAEVAIPITAKVVPRITKLAGLPCRTERTLDAALQCTCHTLIVVDTIASEALCALHCVVGKFAELTV
jgi:hypothetical protein